MTRWRTRSERKVRYPRLKKVYTSFFCWGVVVEVGYMVGYMGGVYRGWKLEVLEGGGDDSFVGYDRACCRLTLPGQ